MDGHFSASQSNVLQNDMVGWYNARDHHDAAAEALRCRQSALLQKANGVHCLQLQPEIAYSSVADLHMLMNLVMNVRDHSGKLLRDVYADVRHLNVQTQSVETLATPCPFEGCDSVSSTDGRCASRCIFFDRVRLDETVDVQPGELYHVIKPAGWNVLDDQGSSALKKYETARAETDNLLDAHNFVLDTSKAWPLFLQDPSGGRTPL